MAVTISPLARQQFAVNGVPLSGGLLFTYQAGTNTKLATYTDSTGGTPNTNPIVLDSQGSCDLWLTQNTKYKFVLSPGTDTDPPSNPYWTRDNIASQIDFGALSGSTGATLVGIGTTNVGDRLNAVDLADYPALRAYTGSSKEAYVTGYSVSSPPQPISGYFIRDDSDSTSADNGGTIFVASNGKRWKRVYNGLVFADWFLVKGDGATDNTSALASLRSWLATVAASGQVPAVAFSAGAYLYTASPNWAIANLKMYFFGDVRLRVTGALNDALSFDGGAAGPGVYNIEMIGRPILEGLSTTGNGLYCRAIHHSKIRANIRGCGATASAANLIWTVTNEYDIVSSVNEAGWYNGGAAKPKYGIYASQRGASEQVAYCAFNNPVLEGMQNGFYFDYALGNTVHSGTVEGCTDAAGAIILTANATHNKFFGTDLEANNTVDVVVNGQGNELHSIDTEKNVYFGATAVNCLLDGGHHGAITVAAGALRTSVTHARYNQQNNAATIADAGTSTRLRDNINVGLGKLENVPIATVDITPGASPYTYANASGNEQTIMITGGTVTAIGFVRGGRTDVTNQTQGTFTLSPGDAVQVTYTAVPFMIKYTR